MVDGSEEERKVTIRMNGDVWKYQVDKDQKLKSIDPKALEDSVTVEEARVLTMVSTVLNDYSYLIG
jgi:hypothetical protein